MVERNRLLAFIQLGGSLGPRPDFPDGRGVQQNQLKVRRCRLHAERLGELGHGQGGTVIPRTEGSRRRAGSRRGNRLDIRLNRCADRLLAASVPLKKVCSPSAARVSLVSAAKAKLEPAAVLLIVRRPPTTLAASPETPPVAPFRAACTSLSVVVPAVTVTVPLAIVAPEAS